MGLIPEIELDGLTGLLFVLFLLAVLWVFIMTSGAWITVFVWLVIVSVVLLAAYYLAINIDSVLRGGSRR